jgi:hypothetical protein
MRLIDANKLVQSIVDERNKIQLRVPCAPYELLDDKPYAAGQNQRGGIRKALRCIAEAPTIDAVPVVRCKDCKYYTTEDFDGDILCGCKLYCAMLDITPDGFCSYGERKEEVMSDESYKINS